MKTVVDMAILEDLRLDVTDVHFMNMNTYLCDGFSKTTGKCIDHLFVYILTLSTYKWSQE